MPDDDKLLLANAAYYRAFRTGDLDAMTALWADRAISCIHPGWPPLIGPSAVMAAWRDMLASKERAVIEFGNAVGLVHGDTGRVICIERTGGMALSATNLFVRIAGEWRMVHHQASVIATAFQRAEPVPADRVLH